MKPVSLLSGLALLAVALSSCASVAPLPRQAPEAGPVAQVVRQGDSLSVRYQFDRPSPVWAFWDSALIREQRQPWRPQQWTVMTPGVVLDRAGHYDILRTTDGGPVPPVVEIRVQPKGVDLEAEYPTLLFSNGAVALPTYQMSVFPVASVAEAAGLPSDLNGVKLSTGPTPVTWRDQSGPVLFGGERLSQVQTHMEKSYVLLGDAQVTQGEGLTAVIDPALPDWMSSTLSQAAPITGQWYRQRLGPAEAGAQKPVLLASWRGPTERMTSMGGSVLPGMIVMSFEGVGISTPNEEIRQRALWFVAHEAAHFWLGQTVRYEYARDAWITEGGADLMAVRALKARNRAYDDRAELQTEIDDCVKYAGKPLSSAGERGEHRAYYACGAVFAMAAEQAQRRKNGGDFLDFLRPLLDRNREDGVLTAQEWMDHFVAQGGRPEAVSLMQEIIQQGSSDPAAAVLALLEGWDVTRRDGRVILS